MFYFLTWSYTTYRIECQKYTLTSTPAKLMLLWGKNVFLLTLFNFANMEALTALISTFKKYLSSA